MFQDGNTVGKAKDWRRDCDIGPVARVMLREVWDFLKRELGLPPDARVDEIRDHFSRLYTPFPGWRDPGACGRCSAPGAHRSRTLSRDQRLAPAVGGLPPRCRRLRPPAPAAAANPWKTRE